jgi:hypothetical protein
MDSNFITVFMRARNLGLTVFKIAYYEKLSYYEKLTVTHPVRKFSVFMGPEGL